MTLDIFQESAGVAYKKETSNPKTQKNGWGKQRQQKNVLPEVDLR